MQFYNWVSARHSQIRLIHLDDYKTASSCDIIYWAYSGHYYKDVTATSSIYPGPNLDCVLQILGEIPLVILDTACIALYDFFFVEENEQTMALKKEPIDSYLNVHFEPTSEVEAKVQYTNPYIFIPEEAPVLQTETNVGVLWKWEKLKLTMSMGIPFIKQFNYEQYL